MSLSTYNVAEIRSGEELWTAGGMANARMALQLRDRLFRSYEDKGTVDPALLSRVKADYPTLYRYLAHELLTLLAEWDDYDGFCALLDRTEHPGFLRLCPYPGELLLVEQKTLRSLLPETLFVTEKPAYLDQIALRFEEDELIRSDAHFVTLGGRLYRTALPECYLALLQGKEELVRRFGEQGFFANGTLPEEYAFLQSGTAGFYGGCVEAPNVYVAALLSGKTGMLSWAWERFPALCRGAAQDCLHALFSASENCRAWVLERSDVENYTAELLAAALERRDPVLLAEYAERRTAFGPVTQEDLTAAYSRRERCRLPKVHLPPEDRRAFFQLAWMVLPSNEQRCALLYMLLDDTESAECTALIGLYLDAITDLSPFLNRLASGASSCSKTDSMLRALIGAVLLREIEGKKRLPLDLYRLSDGTGAWCLAECFPLLAWLAKPLGLRAEADPLMTFVLMKNELPLLELAMEKGYLSASKNLPTLMKSMHRSGHKLSREMLIRLIELGRDRLYTENQEGEA